MERSDCTLADREERILAYLGGTLAALDAEAFEAHYFGCDECWREIQQGLEIRAAFAPAAEASSAAARRIDWRWVAVAAMVVIAVSVWRWTQPAPQVTDSPVPPLTSPPVPAPTGAVTTPPARGAASPASRSEPVLRSPAEAPFHPVATRSANGNVRVRWNAIQKAARYRLTIFTLDAVTVLKNETSTPTVDVEAAALPTGVRLVARVEAIDAVGVIVTTSPRFDIPERREEGPRAP
jgi:Putative zinc-finger